MSRFSEIQRFFLRLEVLLAVAGLALLLQLFPSLLQLVDVRNWSRNTWMLVNVLAVLGLIAYRFAPEVWKSLREQKKNATLKREKNEKQKALQEQREAIERMKEARSRRMY